jgi:hypothetical protein
MLTNAFEDLDLLPDWPASVDLRTGRGGGEDSVAGCGNVEVEGAKGPDPAAEAQVEGESAGDHADVRTGDLCAGEGSTAGGNTCPKTSRRR